MGYNAGRSNRASLTSGLPRPSAGETGLYQRDGWSWARQQADALRRCAVDEIDWENVIEEIESVGRAERGKWVANCAQAIEHLLVIEHWKAATAGDLRHWETEIRAFRIGMAAAIDENPGLHREYAEMLALAWRHGRARAVERLAGHAADEEGTVSPRPHLRIADAQLPDECPDLTEHVAAYDPKRDKQPQPDVWPPGVAVFFNTALRTDYEILRGPQRSRGWSRRALPPASPIRPSGCATG